MAKTTKEFKISATLNNLIKEDKDTQRAWATVLESKLIYCTSYRTLSTDARQDTWFSASSLHVVIENLEIKPNWSV